MESKELFVLLQGITLCIYKKLHCYSKEQFFSSHLLSNFVIKKKQLEIN